MKRLLAVSLGLCTLIAVPVSISAHNLGHIFLRDGRCLEIASAHEGPLIGVDKEQLDLVPGTPQDEFGVSYVGVTRDTPIFPGRCPAPPPAR
jgi:hypothetical protein